MPSTWSSWWRSLSASRSVFAASIFAWISWISFALGCFGSSSGVDGAQQRRDRDLALAVDLDRDDVLFEVSNSSQAPRFGISFA